jgi:hypothetical protein
VVLNLKHFLLRDSPVALSLPKVHRLLSVVVLLSHHNSKHNNVGLPLLPKKPLLV